MRKTLSVLACGLLAFATASDCRAQRLQRVDSAAASTSNSSTGDHSSAAAPPPSLVTRGGNGVTLRGFASSQYTPEQEAGAQQSERLSRPSAPIRTGADFSAFSAAAGNDRLRSRVDRQSQPDASPVTVAGVSQSELRRLGEHDIVLLIDKSSSMKEKDCPSTFGGGIISRWQWCQEQTANLARATAKVLPEGLSVVLFSTGVHVFPKVSLDDVAQIFSAYSPGGFTNEAGAVYTTFSDYFRRRAQKNGNVRPLLVAVITDGLPTDRQGLRDAVIDATHNMRSAGELKMTFLQVGSDPKGIGFVREMDRDLVSEGAASDIVSSKDFPQLLRSGGLTRALVDCISEHAAQVSTGRASK